MAVEKIQVQVLKYLYIVTCFSNNHGLASQSFAELKHRYTQVVEKSSIIEDHRYDGSIVIMCF